ncbi:hypothetical protein [Phenylobacterium sp.]|uniref:hypothetical protein n=1 Tax=Phenylobacterium sp. TaxID=1871053 RepID=UPI00121D4854|nr:hypothetical protein [Phenylobacterium sp.]THD62813.1 MAG: hypothetical protein E8A49_06780 [Phenylobacterium sp.]
MDEVTRLLMLLGLAGIAVTVLAGIARWHGNEVRRIRRGLKVVLGGETHGFLAALGRGRGLGFNFTANQLAVVWDAGAWGLVYSLDELVGAEVIVDGLVVGRVHRGEQRVALNAFDAAERVALRLVFDDLGSPDFTLDLWLPEDEGRRDELPPAEAIAEANRWLARIEALLRRPMTNPRRPAAAPVSGQPQFTPLEPESAAPEPLAPKPATPLAPLFAHLDEPHEPFDHTDLGDEADAKEEEDEIRSLRL